VGWGSKCACRDNAGGQTKQTEGAAVTEVRLATVSVVAKLLRTADVVMLRRKERGRGWRMELFAMLLTQTELECFNGPLFRSLDFQYCETEVAQSISAGRPLESSCWRRQRGEECG